MDSQQIKDIRDQIEFETIRKGPPEGYPKFPDLPAGRYVDEEFYELENEHYWSKLWMFAAHMDELPEPGSYKLWEKARQPVVIYRGRDGTPRAFYNTCTHRGAPVVTEEFGQAEHGLVCGYHGWTFGQEGELLSIRDKRDFVDFDMACRSLIPIRTECYGKLIFVNFDDNAVPLREYLGPVAEQWEEFGFDKVRLVDHYSWDLKCNWKIAMEANMEVYHVKSIHPETVDTSLNYRGNVNTLYARGHSRMVAPGREGGGPLGDIIRNAGPLPDTESVTEIGRTCTQSYHVEPNWVSPLGATIFPVLLEWPKNIRETCFEIWWFAPDWGDGDQPAAYADYIDVFNQVLTEDTQFGDWIQKSVESPAFKGVPLCYQESRIYHMHQAMDQTIGVDKIPAHLRVDPVITEDWMHPNDTEERLRQFAAMRTAAE